MVSLRVRARLLCVALLLLVPAARGEPVTLTDDRGVSISLARPAQRIVTLAPSLAELVFAAGAGDRLIAVSTYTDYPPAAARLPVIGSHGRVDVERVLALAPDLVLAWQSGNPARDLARLERLGIPVFTVEPRRLGDIARALRAVGVLAGTRELAEAAAEAFEREVGRLAVVQGKKPLRVFFEIWHEPLVTVSDAHLIGDLVAHCGGTNVFGGLALLTPRIARESLYAADPDAVISSVSNGARDGARALWRDLPQLRAVREDRVYAVDPSLLHRQGPRVLDGFHAICASLDLARGGR